MERIYSIIPDSEKDNLSDEDRTLIEYTFNKFESIQTRADVQFATEGITTIDKLLNRQAKIGDIVK